MANMERSDINHHSESTHAKLAFNQKLHDHLHSHSGEEHKTKIATASTRPTDTSLPRAHNEQKSFLDIPALHLESHRQVKERHSVRELEVRNRPLEHIKIDYSCDHKQETGGNNSPSFQIDRNGKIHVLAHPDKHNNSTVFIKVERLNGDLRAPGLAEQKALSKLVDYLSERYTHTDSHHNIRRPAVDDPYSLLSRSEKRKVNELPKPEDNFSTNVQESIKRIHRFSGAGTGHISHHDLNQYFPTGNAVGNAELRVYKDVVAGMANVNRDHPYAATSTTSDGRLGIGRYMLTYSSLNAWLEKNPEAAKQLSEKQQFVELMQELRENKSPDINLIRQALPEANQERITADLIHDYAPFCKKADGSVDGARLALSFYLGHVANKHEQSSKPNEVFLTAATRLTSLAAARTLYPGQGFDFDTTTNDKGCTTLALKLAAAAQNESRGSSAHGACSHYVRMAFDKVDPSFNKLFAEYAKDDHLGDDRRFQEICDQKDKLATAGVRPGDTVIYGPRIGTKSAGHIETMGLDHLMHSDFSHQLSVNFAEKYSWIKVYRPVATS